jgi:sugar phosphate isomerase/epimerase
MNVKHTLLLGAALAPLMVPRLAALPIPAEYDTGGFALGCQAYTFNGFTAFEAIDMTADAGGKVIEFFPGQRLSTNMPGAKLSHNMSADELAALKKKLAERHLRAVNYGVVGATGEEQWRKVFEFAKELGLYGITTESVDQLDVIEKLVKEFDIKVGIHDHARREDDPNYKVWDPNYVLSIVQGRDPRIGACADTGHWQTSGLDPLEGIKLLKGRVISLHLKDLDKRGHQGHCVPYGTGQGEIKEILDELKARHFDGNISIEYEYHFGHSLPEVKQCVDFVRKYGGGE